jgi:hypothetical protein
MDSVVLLLLLLPRHLNTLNSPLAAPSSVQPWGPLHLCRTQLLRQLQCPTALWASGLQEATDEAGCKAPSKTSTGTFTANASLEKIATSADRFCWVKVSHEVAGFHSNHWHCSAALAVLLHSPATTLIM